MKFPNFCVSTIIVKLQLSFVSLVHHDNTVAWSFAPSSSLHVQPKLTDAMKSHLSSSRSFPLMMSSSKDDNNNDATKKDDKNPIPFFAQSKEEPNLQNLGL